MGGFSWVEMLSQAHIEPPLSDSQSERLAASRHRHYLKGNKKSLL